MKCKEQTKMTLSTKEVNALAKCLGALSHEMVAEMELTEDECGLLLGIGQGLVAMRDGT